MSKEEISQLMIKVDTKKPIVEKIKVEEKLRTEEKTKNEEREKRLRMSPILRYSDKKQKPSFILNQ